MKVLVIDDEEASQRKIRAALDKMGHEATEVESGQGALDLLAQHSYDAAILDIRSGREQGLDILAQVLAAAPGLRVVFMTALAHIDTAVEAMRRGAFAYLPKPFVAAQIRTVLDKVDQVRSLQRRVECQNGKNQTALPEANLQVDDPAMKKVLELAFKAASSDATILLRGESGTGKGVLARAIHARSTRAERPFVTVNCPCLSAELLESELFGHVRGAFTGAVRDTTGKVAAAEGGTLFLDEIGDLPAPLQPKLLRLLQERQYERVGETRTRTANVRLLAATNRDLKASVAAGQFREDLLYRLNVIELVLPPLRQRSRAIPALAEHILDSIARQMNKPIAGFTPEALAALQCHPWPGNVRELRNVIERAVILAEGERIDMMDLPTITPLSPSIELHGGTWLSLEKIEAEHIRRVLLNTPNLDQAAKVLGIDSATLYRKRKRYGL